MDTITITPGQAIVYGMLITGAVSFVLGLIPLLFGYFKGKLKLGIIAILTMTIGGAVLGVIFSVPALVFFMWLVIKGGKPKNTLPSVETGSENN